MMGSQEAIQGGRLLAGLQPVPGAAGTLAEGGIPEGDTAIREPLVVILGYLVLVVGLV